MKYLKTDLFLIFILVLVLNISCVPISDYKEVIEYLQNFDYLSKDEKILLNKKVDNHENIKDDNRFKRALKDLQVSDKK